MTKRWGIFFSLPCEKLIELPDLIELPTPDLYSQWTPLI
jgi:hypothetical protein